MKIIRPILLVSLLTLASCSTNNADAENAPPPDAARPVIKSEAQLAADRDARLNAGDVVENETPTVDAERRPEPEPVAPVLPLQVPDHAVRADILIVNQQTLSAAELLYPLRDELNRLHDELPPEDFDDEARKLLISRARTEIYSLLVYQEAFPKLGEQQKQMLTSSVEREIDLRVSRRFNGSIARMEKHLEQFGLSLTALEDRVRRELVVSGYTRQLFEPQVEVTRYELLAYYRDNRARFETDETRELLLMEFPFEAYLPNENTNWQRAPRGDQARARLAAMRQARAAAEALQSRSFADVAREFSRGITAERGGSWGAIGQPLKPPYDELSARIFEMQENTHTQPIQTDTGWFIVGCGKINHATAGTFAELQDQLREELEDERFNRLVNNYVRELADNASVSDIRGFVDSALNAFKREHAAALQ